MNRRCRLIYWMFALLMIMGVAASAEEPTPGLLITKENVGNYKEFIPDEIGVLIGKYGMKIKVGKAGSYSISPKEKEYTDKYSGDVKLDGTGRLLNYIAGIPFPSIDLEDPNVGLKIAWNYEYQPAQPDDSDHREIWWYWKGKTGNVERMVKGVSTKVNFRNRYAVPPVPNITPNPRDIRFIQGLKITDPYDLAGVGFVQTRFNPNDPKNQDETVAYVPAVRRLRRMSAAQQYDGYLGTDISLDDYYGYAGSILWSKWKYIKKVKVLAGRDTPNPSSFAGWFPDSDKVRYEIRDAYVVESYPTDPAHHYSKRVHYIDAEFFDTLHMFGYDKKGKLWKIWIQNWAYFPKPHTFVFTGCSVIDIQAEHCTVCPAFTVPNTGAKPDTVAVSEYLKKGAR